MVAGKGEEGEAKIAFFFLHPQELSLASQNRTWLLCGRVEWEFTSIWEAIGKYQEL